MSQVPYMPVIPNPTLRDALNLLKKDIFLSLNCHAIGTIQEFDSAARTVKVTINYTKTRFVKDNASGQYIPKLVPYPLLLDVPIIIMSGGGGTLTFPIAPGDQCLILFNDRDKSLWQTTTNVGGPVPSNRLHSLSDGIALIGLKPAIESYDEERALLQKGGAKVGVGGDTDKVLIENAEQNLLDLLTELISVIKGLTVTVPATGLVSAAPGSPVTGQATGSISSGSQTALDGVVSDIEDLLE